MRRDSLLADLGVSRETSERLEVYASLLARWNERINLVSPKDLAQLWERHILDSLQLAPFIGPSHRVIDLGSGGGFPGLVVAIATGAHTVLIESDVRKSSFLREAARAADAKVEIISRRIEDVQVERAHFVTARALAPVGQLLDWSQRLLLPGGSCLFLKGRNVQDELTQAAPDWHMAVSSLPSRTSPDGVILQLSEIRRVRDPE